MKLPLALLATAVAVAEAGGDDASRWPDLRRRLSFSVIAGYSPGSKVTDHCAIDRDQAAIESQLALKTPDAFANARRIYEEGGNSKPYAMVNLAEGLPFPVVKGDRILGFNAEGLMVGGEAYEAHESGAKAVKVKYSISDIQETYVECQVGALVDTNTRGCLAAEGALTIRGREVPYTYDPIKDNRNGRTIASFSEGDNAKNKMRIRSDQCKGCPYKDFMYFFDYYGTDDYAHQIIMAAFDNKKTNFVNGNLDLSGYGYDGKEQIIMKATAYMNVFMYVIREFEDALDDCERGCVNCNDGSAHAWDEGVCFYTGSIEGTDGLTDRGKLLHQLADKRCENFKTCGVEGTELSGTAKLNYDLFSLFSRGNFQVRSGNCPAARATVKEIISKMYVPMIQGTLRYAMKRGGEKEEAEGAIFAAAVLPRIHAASKSAAATIYENMKVGAASTHYDEVKRAFESVYEDLGITCADVGGIWSEGEDKYFNGAEPCVQIGSTHEVRTETNSTLAIVLSCIFGGLFAVAASMVVYMRSRERQGQPVFEMDHQLDTSRHAGHAEPDTNLRSMTGWEDQEEETKVPSTINVPPTESWRGIIL